MRYLSSESKWDVSRQLMVLYSGIILVSFDVKSLFTSIPLQLALDCTENAIKNPTVELPLPTDDIMDLLNLCLTSTHFMSTTANTTNSYMVQLWALQFLML